jgi:glycosyltransferase involved in cell wall biosynthesis
MNKIKIAIAIPTYNRLDKLKFALEKIEAQELDSRFELYCVISNIGSKDGTAEFLDQLKSDKLKYVIWNKPEENIYVNWRRCAAAVPKEIDWVWFHGDDDFLTHSQVIKGLVDVLEREADEKLSLIHVCQARRSQKTGKTIRGNLFEMCNLMGFHEILGWMSSIVIRNEKFVPAIMQSTQKVADGLRPEEFVTHKISAYSHSASFLEECINDEAIFIDMPWVEPQDIEQTPDSIARWEEVSTAELYFFVVDDIINLYEKGLIKQKLSPVFFRYLSYSFWDRYASFLIASTIQAGKISERNKDHWLRVRKMAELFELERDKKIFIQWHNALNNQIINYEKLHEEIVELEKKVFEVQKNLNEQYQLSDIAVYPFQVLAPDGSLVR